MKELPSVSASLRTSCSSYTIVRLGWGPLQMHRYKLLAMHMPLMGRCADADDVQSASFNLH